MSQIDTADVPDAIPVWALELYRLCEIPGCDQLCRVRKRRARCRRHRMMAEAR